MIPPQRLYKLGGSQGYVIHIARGKQVSEEYSISIIMLDEGNPRSI